MCFSPNSGQVQGNADIGVIFPVPRTWYDFHELLDVPKPAQSMTHKPKASEIRTVIQCVKKQKNRQIYGVTKFSNNLSNKLDNLTRYHYASKYRPCQK